MFIRRNYTILTYNIIMIDCFDGDYRFLSNMYPLPQKIKVVYTGIDSVCKNGSIEVDNTEAAYQAGKADNPKIFENLNGIQSKKLSHKIKMTTKDIEDWDTYKKFMLMKRLLKMKFAIPELKEMLLATGDEELVEGNYWHDTIWGVCDGVGENHLGKMLMEIREDLRNEV